MVLKRPDSPYAVTCAAVAPAALHLTKTCDAALLSAEAAARAVNEIYVWLRVDCEVQEETHHLPVSQDTGLCWTWRERDATRGHTSKTKSQCVFIGEGNAS